MFGLLLIASEVLSREVLVVSVEANGGEMVVVVIMLCLSALEGSYIHGCFAGGRPTARQPLLCLQVTSVCFLQPPSQPLRVSL